MGGDSIGFAARAMLHLVDASPYVFRAYFAMPATIVDPAGRPVQAVHGFVAFLLKLLAEHDVTHLGIAFDESLTTSFRNEFFPDYKAQRALPPPELEAQLADCRAAAEALGARTFSSERYEADDLIATLLSMLGGPAVVVTGDKDFAQLVTEDIAVLDFAKDVRWDPVAVREKLGVRPDQVADLLALAGDSVDNIPGVKGVGKKSAVALLGTFGHVEDLYERLDEVAALDVRGAKSLQKKLAVGREDALLSKRLALMATDAPVEAGREDLRYRGADELLVTELFDRLGFGGLRQRIRLWR